MNKKVRDFLNKKLDDSDHIKRYGDKALDDEIKKIAPNYQWKYEPWKHQKAAILLGTCYSGYGFLMDMGSGKTAAAATVIDIRKHLGEIKKKTLVLCPKMVIGSWAREVPKFTNLSIDMLKGSTPKNWASLHATQADVVVVSYGSLIAMLCPLIKGKGGTRKRIIDEKLISTLCGMFDCLVLDESQHVKNRESTTTRTVGRIADEMPFRYILTGTPMHSTQDLFSQYWMIDKGGTFGNNITLFRSAFMLKSENPWGGYDYFLKPGVEAHINRRLRHRALRYSSEEFENLPKRIDTIVSLPFESKAKAHYNKLLKEVKGETDTKSLENYFVRMRQVSSGFIDSKKEGNPIKIRFGKSAKVDWLHDFIEGLKQHEKVVIFHEFKESSIIISETLKTCKVSHVIMKKTDDVDSFVDNKKIKAIIINSQSGGAGLNLQVAKFVIFWESPVSVIIRKQAMKRVHRSGQTKTVYHYDLQIKDSIEERIADGLSRGINILDTILDGSEKL